MPSSVTALLQEEQTPWPTPRPPVASIQNPLKKQDNLLCEWWVLWFFYLVNYSIWIVALTCLLLQRPSSMNYIHYAPRCALPWLQSRTPLKDAGQLILQVVSYANFYFLQLFNLICSSWRALFCHPPLICITNPMPRPPMAWIESLSEEPSDWPHQWWVFVSYFILSTI